MNTHCVRCAMILAAGASCATGQVSWGSIGIESVTARDLWPGTSAQFEVAESRQARIRGFDELPWYDPNALVESLEIGFTMNTTVGARLWPADGESDVRATLPMTLNADIRIRIYGEGFDFTHTERVSEEWTEFENFLVIDTRNREPLPESLFEAPPSFYPLWQHGGELPFMVEADVSIWLDGVHPDDVETLSFSGSMALMYSITTVPGPSGGVLLALCPMLAPRRGRRKGTRG